LEQNQAAVCVARDPASQYIHLRGKIRSRIGSCTRAEIVCLSFIGEIIEFSRERS
jgi:hypothetical protein